MYYILYERLKIKSNEPVYCTLYIYKHYSSIYVSWLMHNHSYMTYLICSHLLFYVNVVGNF